MQGLLKIGGGDRLQRLLVFTGTYLRNEYVRAFKSHLTRNKSRAYCSKFDVLLQEAGCTIKLNHLKNLSWLILSQLLLMPEILLP